MVGSLAPIRFVTLMLVGFLSACSSNEDRSEYQTAAAEVGDVRDIVPATGSLVAEGDAEIRATRQGVIAQVLVQENQTVLAGQVLARLASPTRNASRDEAVANVGSADASLREAGVTLADARQKLERTRILESKDFLSPAAVSNGEAEVERAQAAVERISSERAAAHARLRLADAEGQGNDIIAPLDGVVTLANVRVGQQVSPEDPRPLFQTGQDISALTLEILISEADLPRVSLTSRVRFSVDAYPGIFEDATLRSIGAAPIKDGRFVSYRALASVNNRSEVLKPGMSASVQIVRADARDALRIPARAVYFMPPDYISSLEPAVLAQLKAEYQGDMKAVRAGARGLEFRRMLQEGTRIVFVLQNGQPVRREIRVGAETDDYLEVVEGLEEGALVILGARDASSTEEK